MSFNLTERDLKRLQGVHPALVRVIKTAAERSPVQFTVLEGLRTAARQKELFAKGATKTMNSRHLTGHAVDVVALVNGKASWSMHDYAKIAQAFKRAAYELGVPIVWGGDWSSFKDGPHFELDRKRYP